MPGASTRRTHLRQLCGCLAAPFSALLPGGQAALAQSSRPIPARAQRDAWADAQMTIEDANAMASRVVAALDGLTGSLATWLAQIKRQEDEVRRLLGEVSERTNVKNRELGEFRSGMYCSGCMQTRSQILAKGETFPHPGRTIVLPTEQQIREKEAELQAPIDDLRRRLPPAEQELLVLKRKRDEGRDQCDEGAWLWRTAVSWWTAASAEAMRARLKQIDTAIEELTDLRFKAHVAYFDARGTSNEAALLAERAVYDRLIEQQRQARGDFIAKSSEATQQLVQRRNRMRDLLNQYFNRPPVATQADDGFVQPMGSASTMGLFFLMGDIPSRKDTSTAKPKLPAVEGFIARYQASGVTEAAPASPLSHGVNPPAPREPARPAPANTRPGLLDRLP